jgi:hypothetical protein
MMLKQKTQSLHWILKTSPRPKKSMASSVQCESDAVFFDCEGVIHHEFLPRGQMVHKEYYLKVMKEEVRKRRLDLWRGKKWLLHHDKAPAHSSLLIHDSLTKHEMTPVPQSLHLPNLAPADFFLLTKLKSLLKGQFESVEEIKENSLAERRSILKEAFRECFQNWKKH